MEITLEKNPDVNEIQKFLEKVDADVIPALSSQHDLSVYAAKIASFAECLIFRKNDEIGALSAFYCNDAKNKAGFITLLAVESSLRKQGIAGKLVVETMRHAKSKGMEKIVFETHEKNLATISLFRKFGFEILKTENDGAVFMGLSMTEI